MLVKRLLFTGNGKILPKLFYFLFKVTGQPCVQQTLSLLLPLLGFFIQTLDPQLISQVRIVSNLGTLLGKLLNWHNLKQLFNDLFSLPLLTCYPFFVEMQQNVRRLLVQDVSFFLSSF